jgi:ribosomal protein L6P/L9E
MTIYIVEGSTGEYSDHQEWPVIAYKNEEDAKAHVEQASAFAREIMAGSKSHMYNDIRDAKNPYDVNMRIDYTGVNYRYYSIELVD